MGIIAFIKPLRNKWYMPSSKELSPKELTPELLSLLVCPKDKGELHFDEVKQTLTCKKCKSIYPIRDAIPNMLG